MSVWDSAAYENTKKLLDIADSVVDMTCYNADKENAKDIPEFIAYEIIDLVEIKTECEYQNIVASMVLKRMPEEYISYVAGNHVKKHFGILEYE